MPDDCDVCGNESTKHLNMFGDKGALRIPLCDDCSEKAKRRDPDTWEKIRAILRGE